MRCGILYIMEKIKIHHYINFENSIKISFEFTIRMVLKYIIYIKKGHMNVIRMFVK